MRVSKSEVKNIQVAYIYIYESVTIERTEGSIWCITYTQKFVIFCISLTVLIHFFCNSRCLIFLSITTNVSHTDITRDISTHRHPIVVRTFATRSSSSSWLYFGGRSTSHGKFRWLCCGLCSLLLLFVKENSKPSIIFISHLCCITCVVFEARGSDVVT